MFKKIKKLMLSVKKYPWRETFQSLKYLPRVFTRVEKIIILALIVVIVVSLTNIGYASWSNGTNVLPSYGGTFTEGIIGDTKDLNKHLSRLVYAGLTKYDQKMNIVGDLAEKWEVKDDGRVYEFQLRPNFNSEDLLAQIKSKGMWQDIEVTAPDPGVLKFTFKRPFSPFLYASTEPIFEYGPYRKLKETKNEVELTAREDYYMGKPYIEKMVLKLFDNKDELKKAANRGDIQGFYLPDKESFKGFDYYAMDLRRYTILFFNLSNKDLQNIETRRALRDYKPIKDQLTFRLVTSDNPKNIDQAKEMIDKWQKNNVKVTLDVKDNVTLQKTTLPKRDYDLLLYGLDYGQDPDPYPFWHSSQIKEDGKNLSNFKNEKADKLLEDARQDFDFKRREDRYNEFQKVLEQEVPMFVVEKFTLHCYVSNRVKGVEKITGYSESDIFLYSYQWFIKIKRESK